jgi:hypothetical protein
MKLLMIGLLLFFGISFSTNIHAADESTQQNTQKQSLIDILKRMEKKYQQLELRQENIPLSLVKESLPLSNNSAVSISNLMVPVEVLKAGIPEGEELLLSIYIDRLYVGDIFGYKSKNGAKISLQDLFSVLEFPININMNEKMAKGWFISENKGFDFNFGNVEEKGQQSSTTILGKSEIVDENAFHIQDSELFVESELISKWFGLNIVNEFNDLRIRLMPNEPLPIQLRLARKNKKIFSGSNNQVTLPWKESSYQILSSPLLDFQLRAVEGSGNNANFASYSALGSHDLAFMNTEYFIAGQDGKGLSDARVKFSEELEDGTFWFLPAASVEFGDVNAVTINNKFNGGLNRGMTFSKGRSDVNNNQRININGDIQPGWDIELYQNNIIVAQQTSIQSGRYEFNNIDLIYGNNNFEIISYGPQGQVKKEYRDVFIDSNAIKKAEQNYAFSLTQQGKSLLGVNDDLASGNSGFLFAGNYSVGLTDWFSLTLGQSSLLGDNDDNAFNYSAGVSLSLFERLLLNASINVDQNEQYKADFTARTRWLGQSLLYSFRNQEFESVGDDELIQKNNDMLHTFSMSGSLPNLGDYRLNYNNNLSYSDNANGDKLTNIQNLVSVSAGRFSMQNSLIWTKNKTLLDSNELVSGSMLMQGRLGAAFTRWAVNYSLYPESNIDSITSQFSWQMYGDWNTDVKFDYSPDEKSYRAALGLTWQHDSFVLTSNFTYNDQDEWTAGLFLRFGFGYDVINQKPFISASALSQHGAMAVRVFEDKNNDGILDNDETIFAGVKVKALQSNRQAVTGTDGLAIIKNLPAFVKTDIVIDPNSLDDPFLIPSSDGVSITPRKGFLERIDYPVVSSSEVDGTVYAIDADGNERSLDFVAIHLKNAEGDIVQTTQSEYDGYYLFVDLLPGQYSVSVGESYLKKHGLKNIGDIAVNLTAQGDVINGSDFTLQELAFTKGYVANVGKFNNLSMLKVYWHLIQRRYRATLKQKTFYVRNDDTGDYMLNLGFYPDIKQAEQACGKTTEASIDCAVTAYEFAIQ